MTQPVLNMQQHRWMELVKDYDPEISYHPGKANNVVDSLSQRPIVKLVYLLIKPNLMAETKDLQVKDIEL